MRRFLRRYLLKLSTYIRKSIVPQPNFERENRILHRLLDAEAERNSILERIAQDDAMERIGEMIEARNMAGAGPWRIPAAVVEQTDALIDAARAVLQKPAVLRETFEAELANRGLSIKESSPMLAQGAYGDIELALQNVEWRREINLSWLEFSRWGIQQIILISRLNFIKNPTIQRGCNVSAHYVFGRGFEVSSPDADANEVLKEFFERNKKVLGQIALTELEKRKYYDGNLFFAFFADSENTGESSVRTIDATEIQDIVTDPDDSDTPWYYLRVWTMRLWNPETATFTMQSSKRWYPALGYDPDEKPAAMGGIEVEWKVPIYHRKCGGVAKWLFGCPLVYAALDWAKASKRFLEACATVRQSLAQIAMIMTTKGGQAALEGAKQQLGTTVGPSSSLWDENPTAVNASIFASGPGTKLEAFNTRGAGGDPEEVRRFELMVWRVFGLPETFGGDVKTGNLATAQSLDRPTELNFLEKQEAWREDLTVIAKWVLATSFAAPKGKLREAIARRRERSKVASINVFAMPDICEAARVSKHGHTVRYEAAKPSDDKLEVMVTFPSIREGDIPALVGAVVQGMTLGNKGGQIIGVDERAGIRKLYEHLDIEDGDELIEDQYPLTGKDKYDPNRTKEDAADLKPPIPTAPVYAKPGPEAPGGKPQEAYRRLTEALRRLKNRAA